MTLELEDAIEAERERRRAAKRRGHPLHYWRARGDAEPPCDEYWCDWCVGFYGVPHEISKKPEDRFFAVHIPGQLCRNVYSQPRQCARIDCVVAESAARRAREAEQTTETETA
jgi:hypothetical protein